MHISIKNSCDWGYEDPREQQEQYVSLQVPLVLPFPKLNEDGLFRDPAEAAPIPINSESTLEELGVHPLHLR